EPRHVRGARVFRNHQSAACHYPCGRRGAAAAGRGRRWLGEIRKPDDGDAVVRSPRGGRRARRAIAGGVQGVDGKPGADAGVGEALMKLGMKCIVSAVVMFIMAWALSFVVHGVLLSADYAITPGMRPPAEAQQIIGWLILAQALFGVAFAWVY